MRSSEHPYELESFERLPAEAVEVVYENPRIKLPFKPKDLALFLEPKRGTTKLGVREAHHRSAELPTHMVIGEYEGGGDDAKRRALYFTVDLKGIGFVHPEGYESKKEGYRGRADQPAVVLKEPAVEMPWGYDVLGLLDRRLFDAATREAAELSEAGARTEGIAAGLKISKLFYEGNLRTVDELRRAGILPKSEQYEPVIAVRVLRSKTRIMDFVRAAPAERRAMLAETFDALNRESEKEGKIEKFDVKDAASVKRYLAQTAAWSGKNLAVLHNTGKAHHFFNSHNITLAGEMVDLDSVGKVVVPAGRGFAVQSKGHGLMDRTHKIPRVFLRDIRDMVFALKMQIDAVGEFIPLSDADRRQIATSLVESYRSSLSEIPAVALTGIAAEQYRTVVKSVADDIIVRGRTMRPIVSDKEYERQAA